MILQASYTAVDGSNCIVFTTLHWRTHIFSDSATMLAGGVDGGCSYTCTEQGHREVENEVQEEPDVSWLMFLNTFLLQMRKKRD